MARGVWLRPVASVGPAGERAHVLQPSGSAWPCVVALGAGLGAAGERMRPGAGRDARCVEMRITRVSGRMLQVHDARAAHQEERSQQHSGGGVVNVHVGKTARKPSRSR